MVGVFEDRPVYLQDVASLLDGPAEAESYTRIGFSRRYLREKGEDPIQPTRSAVTLVLAKKAGTNAVQVAKSVIQRMEQLKEEVLPTGRCGDHYPGLRGHRPGQVR